LFFNRITAKVAGFICLTSTAGGCNGADNYSAVLSQVFVIFVMFVYFGHGVINSQIDWWRTYVYCSCLYCTRNVTEL